MRISTSGHPCRRTASTTYGQKYRFMFQRIKFLQKVIRNKSEDKRRHVGWSDVLEQQILVHFKLKQDACSDVHTGLKMATFVVGCNV
jgi:hypothetical protein